MEKIYKNWLFWLGMLVLSFIISAGMFGALYIMRCCDV